MCHAPLSQPKCWMINAKRSLGSAVAFKLSITEDDAMANLLGVRILLSRYLLYKTAADWCWCLMRWCVMRDAGCVMRCFSLTVNLLYTSWNRNRWRIRYFYDINWPITYDNTLSSVRPFYYHSKTTATSALSERHNTNTNVLSPSSRSKVTYIERVGHGT